MPGSEAADSVDGMNRSRGDGWVQDPVEEGQVLDRPEAGDFEGSLVVAGQRCSQDRGHAAVGQVDHHLVDGSVVRYRTADSYYLYRRRLAQPRADPQDRSSTGHQVLHSHGAGTTWKAAS